MQKIAQKREIERTRSDAAAIKNETGASASQVRMRPFWLLLGDLSYWLCSTFRLVGLDRDLKVCCDLTMKFDRHMKLAE